MASSLTSSSSNSAARRPTGCGYSRAVATLKCKCGEMAGIGTSWTRKHSGMRFYGYHYFPHKDCKFFGWVDDDMSQRAKDVINGYRAENMKLRKQIEELCSDRGYVIQNDEPLCIE